MERRQKTGRVAILIADGFEQVELIAPRWAKGKVVVDGHLVTSRKPADIPAFNDQMLKAFGSRKKHRG